MPSAKVRDFKNTDSMTSEQKIIKTEKEGQDSFDNILQQAIGRDPFLSLSRAGDSPIQWIQLLHALDQQGSSKVSRSSNVANGIGKQHSLDICNVPNSISSELNGHTELVHALKDSEKGTKGTSDQLQTLKIPEAVSAFAQAAAKANGETEKYLPGWPLLSPSKAQLQKCDKCSREFASTINYRRHARVHRRSLNIDKDSPRSRDFLGAFWDKLSMDEAKELVSLSNLTMEEVSGSLILRTLSSWIRKPGFSSLPQIYVKAGATLLDVVQARASRFPISSQELFSVLDDASEKTFLCAGTALSLQKYVFDGETGKNALDMKNLVACTSFLLEQKLVKAWLADKDAEALRCQKLLVEEEEAAQRRQADLLERKRMKKLRQKELKAKELSQVDKVNPKACSSSTAEVTSGSTGTPSPKAPSESNSNISEASLSQDPLYLDSIESVDSSVDLNLRSPFRCEDADQNLGHQMEVVNRPSKSIPALRLLPKPSRHSVNGFYLGQIPGSKSSAFTRHGNFRDAKGITLANGHKIWTRKSKAEDEGKNEMDMMYKEQGEQQAIVNKNEVLIGSISVALGDGNGYQRHPTLRRDNFHQKLSKSDSGCSAMKLWRPVSRHGNGECATLQNEKGDTEMNGFPDEASGQTFLDMDCLASGGMNGVGSDRCEESSMMQSDADSSGVRLFSSKVAEAFLTERWKEAITAEHVRLVLSPEAESSDCLEDRCGEARPQSVNHSGRSVLGSTENLMGRVGGVEPASAGASKLKFKAKPEKSYGLKYIPKRRSNFVEK